MGKYKDNNNVSGASPANGMKNDDGREMGNAYNSSNDPAMNPKSTFSPNDDVPSLGQIPGSLED